MHPFKADRQDDNEGRLNRRPFSLSNDWTPAQRVAFRFGVVYLTLFCLATQISGSLIPNLWFTYRGLGRLWPMREITHWIARTAFGVTVPLDDVSGGETLFFWIQWAWVLVAAVRDQRSLVAARREATQLRDVDTRGVASRSAWRWRRRCSSTG